MARDNGNTLETYRKQLAIDPSDLEGCLVTQAELFWNVSDASVRANARRDKLKLDVEQLHAKLDQEYRGDAEAAKEKITEAGITNKIKDSKEMQALKGDHIAAISAAAQWEAMKESFQIRSYAIRDLVQIELRRMTMAGDTTQAEKDANDLKREKEFARQRSVVRDRKKLGKYK